MRLRMGSQLFEDVVIPVLWGERAVVQDDAGALSVIDLGHEAAKLEVLADAPAPGVEFLPDVDGFTIRTSAGEYKYNPLTKTLSDPTGRLPDVQISVDGIRIGSNFVGGGTVSGFGVGIAISEDGIALGAPLPSGLAALVV